MDYTTVNFLGLSMVVLLLFWLWQKTRDVFSFPNVFSASFSLPVLGGQLWYRFTENPYQPTPDTVLLFYGAWIALLLGAATVIRRSPRTVKITPVDGRIGKLVLMSLMLMHAAYTVAVIRSTGLAGIISANQYGLVDSFAANRLDNAATNQTASRVGWFFEAWHIAYIYYVPLAIYLYRQRQISRRILPFICVFAGILSLVMFSRVQFVMLIVFGGVAWLTLFRPPWRKVLFNAGTLLCAAVAMFMGMQSVLIRVGSNSDVSLSDQLATYAFSSAPAFQEMVNGNYYQPNPHNVLFMGEGIYYVLGKLSLLNAEEYPIGFREWVYVPDATNVYTFLDYFVLDFGRIGVILGPFLTGMLMAWTYNRLGARISYPRLLLYGFCVYSCFIANLANFLLGLITPIFLGIVFILHSLVGHPEAPIRQKRGRLAPIWPGASDGAEPGEIISRA